MATKKELQAQAEEAGVEVASDANKADIEQALVDAGVEPADDSGPKNEWFKNKDTGVVFAAREGTALHSRVTAPRNEATYEKTSAPPQKSED